MNSATKTFRGLLKKYLVKPRKIYRYRYGQGTNPSDSSWRVIWLPTANELSSRLAHYRNASTSYEKLDTAWKHFYKRLGTKPEDVERQLRADKRFHKAVVKHVLPHADPDDLVVYDATNRNAGIFDAASLPSAIDALSSYLEGLKAVTKVRWLLDNWPGSLESLAANADADFNNVRHAWQHPSQLEDWLSFRDGEQLAACYDQVVVSRLYDQYRRLEKQQITKAKAAERE